MSQGVGLASCLPKTAWPSDLFIEKNQKIILIVVAALIVIVLGFFGFKRYYIAPKQAEAQSQMFMAEKYFEMDSLNKALNGDGNYLGFLDIAKDYRFTNSGNLARYSAGICYLHLGNFKEAIEYLNKYSKKDKVIGSMAIGATGDAYIELGDLDKGVAKYIEAADFAKNSFNTPLFLMKAGEIYELKGKFPEALKIYERIESEYPESTEGTTIDKYIARVKLLIK